MSSKRRSGCSGRLNGKATSERICELLPPTISRLTALPWLRFLYDPLPITVGDITSPLYFDFIGMIQYEAVTKTMSGARQRFPEFCEDCEDQRRIVTRPPQVGPGSAMQPMFVPLATPLLLVCSMRTTGACPSLSSSKRLPTSTKGCALGSEGRTSGGRSRCLPHGALATRCWLGSPGSPRSLPTRASALAASSSARGPVREIEGQHPLPSVPALSAEDNRLALPQTLFGSRPSPLPTSGPWPHYPTGEMVSSTPTSSLRLEASWPSAG